MSSATISDVWIAPPETGLATQPHLSNRRLPHLLWWLATIPAGAFQIIGALRSHPVATPFEDEGLYVYEGHQMIAHILHGYFIPEFPGSYFSGSPGVYPMLAALGDHFGGLAGARFVSTIFAVAAMAFVFGLAKELFGGIAGVVAIGFFVTAGPIIYLSSFATYDMMMLASAIGTAWFAVASMRKNLLLQAPVVALLMSLTFFIKYAGAVYTPLIALLIVAVGWPLYRWLAVKQAMLTVLLAVTFTLALLATIEHNIVPGVRSTTVSRKALAPGSTSEMLRLAYGFDGYWYVAGAVGLAMLIVLRPSRWRIYIALALLAVVPMAEQIRIHELTSWSKHVAFGVAFSSVLVGGAASALWNLLSRHKSRLFFLMTAALRTSVTGVVALVLVQIAPSGRAEANHSLTAWPDDSKLVSVLRQEVRAYPHKPILGESPSPERYGLAGTVSGAQWKDTYQLFYMKKIGAPAYLAAIRANYFGVIFLTHGTPYGKYVASILHQGDYHLAAKVPRYLRGQRVGDWLVFRLGK